MKKIIFFFAAMLLILSTAVAQKTMISSSERGSVVKSVQQTFLPEGNELNAFYEQGGYRAPQTVWWENFDGPAFPPTGWTLYSTPFTYYNDYGRTTPPSFGYDAASSAYPIYGITTHAFTPAAGALFSFWAMHGATYTASSSWYTAYRIKVSTTNNLPASFTTIKEYGNFAYTGMHTNRVIFTSAQIANWYQMTVDLTPYAGQQIYMAVEVYDHYGDDEITIDDMGVLMPTNNDLAILANGFPYTKIPQSQAQLLPFPNMIAKAVNVGKVAQTSVVTSVTHNGTPIGSSNTIANLAAGATSANMTVTPIAGTAFPTTLGNNNLVYTVSAALPDDDPSDNSKSFSYEITPNLYAVDDVGPAQIASGGVGVGTAGSIMGQIYTIAKPTFINQVVVGFSQLNTGTQGLNIRLYGMSGATTLASVNPIFSQPFNRAAGWSTVNVPSTLLMPGNYFLCVQELTAVNCAMAYDAVLGRGCYYNTTGTTALTFTDGFGSVAIRMVTGELLNMDMLAISISGPPTPMAVTPTNYSVIVRNVGLQPVNNFTVSVVTDAGVILATQNVSATLNTGDNYTANFSITFPQAWAGPLKIKGVVTMTGDMNPANNETPLISLNIIPHPGYLVECSESFITAPGAITSQYEIPINTFYRHSYTQQIYTAAEVGLTAGQQISAISFQYVRATSETKTNQSIYLGNIQAKAQFTTTTDWVPVGQMQLVKNPTTITYDNSNPWFTIQFDNPFTYDGGNLVVAFLNNHGTYVNSTPTFNQHAGTANTFRTLHYRVDGTTIINPASPPTASGRVINRSNIHFFGSCVKYYTLNPNDIYDAGAVVTTSTPYPVPEGGNLTVYFSCDDPCRYISDVVIDGQSKGPITSWTWTNITNVLPVIHVVTEYVQIPITFSAGPNGTGVVSPPDLQSGVYNVNCGFNQKFSFLPAMGYVVDYFEVDGVLQPKAGSYTFNNVTAPHTIHVEFKEAPYKIVFTHVGDGQVIPVGKENEIPNGQIGMDDGDMQQFIFIPDPNWMIQAVYIDGVLNMGATISGSYMFINVHENHTVHVIFKLIDKYILATTGPNGTINPAGNVPVPYGTCKEFTITANTGYVIDQVFIDGEALEGLGGQLAVFQYAFCDVIENHTIYATFKVATWEIAVTWDACGNSKLTPSGTNGIVYVPHNAIQIITFVPDEGCKVVEVLIDGVPYPNAIPTGSYTFYYVTSNRSIHVTFEKIKYQVKSSINDHGVIDPNGTSIVNHGDNITYEFYAFPGFEVVNVFVDGIDYPPAIAAGEYTFTNVKAPHTINVITAPLSYKITAVAETGGFITPSGTLTVGYGQNQMFTFKAASGYEIEYVYIDGMINMEAAVNGSYAFLNVKADHSIKVTFKLLRYYVVALPPANGLIEPIGTTEMTYFDEITYTITPDEGYKISYVLVNGTNMGKINTFTFNEVEADGNIEAFFAAIEEEVDIDLYNLGISIYSNANTVYVANKNLRPITDVSIFDMYGRVVWQGNVYETLNQIPLAVSTGIYTVRVATEAGFTTTKVNIQR